MLQLITRYYTREGKAITPWFFASFLIVLASSLDATYAQDTEASADLLPFNPRSYVVYYTLESLEIDGVLDEATWQQAQWTANFVDIEGRDQQQLPRFQTRAKVLWDDEALYIAAQLEEPHVWATFTERDAVIYQDNAFEVFIDPAGDTHNYYELEVNALETFWDLMLVKPFRDGGPSLSAWDIRGLEVGVDIEGTLNDPSDIDEGWTVELALPWDVLEEAAPERRPPKDGEQWRLNFARAQWQFEVIDSTTYQKKDDVAADWWVWTPQGAVNMHMPERWGYVQFSEEPVGKGRVPFVEDPNEWVKWALRQLYYRQRDYYDARGHYADDLVELNADGLSESAAFEPELQATQSTYEITAPGADGATMHIRHDGKVWMTAN